MVHEITSTGGVEAIPPLFYVMARGLDQKHLDAIGDALCLTPCQAVVISDLLDSAIAWNFAPMVMRASDELIALKIARETAIRNGMPVLVIGNAKGVLDAIYRDGHVESVGVTTNANSN